MYDCIINILYIFANHELQRMVISNGFILCGVINSIVMISQMMRKQKFLGIEHFGIEAVLGSLKKTLQDDMQIIEIKGDRL